jgi:hypothetical protein
MQNGRGGRLRRAVVSYFLRNNGDCTESLKRA